MTLSQSLSDEVKIRDVSATSTSQGWVVGIDIGHTTTLYLTKSEAVDLFAVLASILKGGTK